MKNNNGWTIYHTGILSMDRVHNEKLDKLAEEYYSMTAQFSKKPVPEMYYNHTRPMQIQSLMLAQRPAKSCRIVSVDGSKVAIREWEYLVKLLH